METGAVAPPRLAPVSGVLNQGQCVIKPIACRPVVTSTTPRTTPSNGSPCLVGRHVIKCSANQQPPSHLKRFSWSKSQEPDHLTLHRPHGQRQLEFRPDNGAATPQCHPATTSNSSNSRVADLSRRFGGSLSSVAVAANSPVQMRQPPAYRPPPNSRIVKSGNGTTYSSSELHLNRMARTSVQPQWVLGGSEVNLSCLSRSTLPRQEGHQHSSLHHQQHAGQGVSYEPMQRCSNGSSRSSWAGLPSSTDQGSSCTLSLIERREDAATPIVEEGKIRSRMMMHQGGDDWLGAGSLGSAGSLDDCDGDYTMDDGTPSPSDSGVSVAELEAQLKEKDCEIALLRETLEQNEAVIFQVYQEKEKSWERELKKLRSLYEDRMRSAQQQASLAERQLQTQTQQWQGDRKSLKEQVQQLCQQEQQLQGRLEETSWSLCQKNGEMALLKSQLKDAAVDQSQRVQEISKLRCQVKDSHEMLHNTRQRLEHVLNERQPLDNRRITSPLAGRKTLHVDDSSPSTLKNEMLRLQRRLIEQQQSIEAERQVWHEEKATVLVYQRHLQQQYVQAMKRNQQLDDALGLLGITGVPSMVDVLSSTSSSPKTMSSPKSTCSDPITIDLDSFSSSSNSETPC